MSESIPLEKLLQDAERFKRVCETEIKSKALKFFNELPEDSRNYIEKNYPYSIYLRASQIQC